MCIQPVLNKPSGCGASAALYLYCQIEVTLLQLYVMTAGSIYILIKPCKESNFQAKVLPNCPYCPHWIQGYLCYDLQELGSVHRLCTLLAYSSKTEARATKEFNNRKQAEFAPHKSSCIAINNGLYPADMVTEY